MVDATWCFQTISSREDFDCRMSATGKDLVLEQCHPYDSLS